MWYYYNWCNKWKCEIDAQGMYNCFKERDKPIRDIMVGVKTNDYNNKKI